LPKGRSHLRTPPSGFLPVKDNMLALRNVGALKLSNILQLDRFEEDLSISKVRLPQDGKQVIQSSCERQNI
jgi:hypothetical protein